MECIEGSIENAESRAEICTMQMLIKHSKLPARNVVTGLH